MLLHNYCLTVKYTCTRNYRKIMVHASHLWKRAQYVNTFVQVLFYFIMVTDVFKHIQKTKQKQLIFLFNTVGLTLSCGITKCT